MVTASGRLVARISFRLGRQVFFQPSRSGLFLGLVLEYYALKERKETKKKKGRRDLFYTLNKSRRAERRTSIVNQPRPLQNFSNRRQILQSESKPTE